MEAQERNSFYLGEKPASRLSLVAKDIVSKTEGGRCVVVTL